MQTRYDIMVELISEITYYDYKSFPLYKYHIYKLLFTVLGNFLPTISLKTWGQKNYSSAITKLSYHT